MRFRIKIAWCLLWLWLVGCSDRPFVGENKETRLVDSLLVTYRDSMAESPRQVIDVFSAARSHLRDSLCYYRLLSQESRCYYYLNQMDEAFGVNGQVLAYCERNAMADGNRMRLLLGEAYNNRGVFWQELGRRDSALLSLEKAAEVLDGATPRTSLSSVYINLADCYMQEGDYSRCGYYYRRALLRADSLGIGDRDYFSIYSGLAKLYTELGNYPEGRRGWGSLVRPMSVIFSPIHVGTIIIIRKNTIVRLSGSAGRTGLRTLFHSHFIRRLSVVI